MEGKARVLVCEAVEKQCSSVFFAPFLCSLHCVKPVETSLSKYGFFLALLYLFPTEYALLLVGAPKQIIVWGLSTFRRRYCMRTVNFLAANDIFPWSFFAVNTSEPSMIFSCLLYEVITTRSVFAPCEK